MVLRGMIHHEIEADADAVPVALVGEVRQILHRSQLRLNLSEISYRVAAVAASRRALEQRHQVKIVHAAVLQVVKMAPDALQIAREAVRVHQHAQHLVALVPVRHHKTRVVPFLQRRGPLLIVLVEHGAEIVEGLLIVMVKLKIQPFELVIVLLQALLKFRFPVPVNHVFCPPLLVLKPPVVIVTQWNPAGSPHNRAGSPSSRARVLPSARSSCRRLFLRSPYNENARLKASAS